MPTSEFPNLHVVNHPLIQHKLTHMRKSDTMSALFRQLLCEIGMLMGYEATRNLPIKMEQIETPLTPMQSPIIEGEDVAIVPILRAGLPMAEGLMKLMPTAKEGHIGLYRDPVTKMPVEYLVKLPSIDHRKFILVDPMLATGNSAVYAIDILVDRGVDLKNIVFMALVAAPEGMRVFNKKYPNIQVFTASLDSHLDDHAYIVPGLGDAGDRLFGTK